jgi:hypothetical protein
MVFKNYISKFAYITFLVMASSGLMYAQINDNLNIKAKPRKTDLEINNLVGKVNTYREEFFVSDKDVGFKRYYTYFSDEYQQFNEQGFIVTKKLFGKEGNVIYKKVIDYDLNGKVASESEFDTANVLSSKVAYTYNDKGMLLETNYEEGNTSPITSRFTYAPEAFIPSKEEFYINGTLLKVSYFVIEANGNKRVTDSSFVSGNSGPKYKSKVELYDSNENMLEQITYETNGEISLKYEYTFDKNNNNVEFKCYGPRGVLEGDYVYKFNEKNFMIEETKFIASKNTKDSLLYEYKYDANGNWIEKTTMHHNVPKSIVKRVIQYY